MIKKLITKTVEIQIPEAVFCDRCSTQLEFLIPEEQGQCRGSLEIRLSGGYGMYFDDPPIDCVICTACADLFFAENPWLNRKELPDDHR